MNKPPAPHLWQPSRREFLYVGLLGTVGVTMSDLFRMEARAAGVTPGQLDATAGKAKSVINIYLPRNGGTPTESEAASTGLSQTERRSEIVLVVEDDDAVRNLTVTRLTTLGFKIHEAPDGASAVKLLEGGLKVDLLFSDLVMPGGLTGYDVAKRAKEIDPGIRILLTSGYAEDLLRAESLGSLKLLRKPYRLADLRQALDEVFSDLP